MQFAKKLERSLSAVTLYSVGYGNRGFEAFLDLIRQYKFSHLVDVRSVPQSAYWEDFRRERLAFLMSETEIRYVYMGDTLGAITGSAVLCKDPDSVDIEPLRQTDYLALGIDKLTEAASDPKNRIVLMCGCLRPHRCHRSRLLGPPILKKGIDYQHVDEHGNLRSHREVELESEPQGALF
ncbi:MAG TPA: DUF488 domain-containing protein [Fimbriimonadaceae bacterium]|nr:DUF488 domain-containing protein [Fimbriimonadaceae bacterium]